MRALVLLAAAGAACGDGLSGAVRARLGGRDDNGRGEGTTTVKFPASFPDYCMGVCPSTIQGQNVPANALAQVKSAGQDLCVDPRSVVAADGTVTINNWPTYTPGKSRNVTCSRALTSMQFVYEHNTSEQKNEQKNEQKSEQKNGGGEAESTSPPSPAAVLAPAIMGVVGVLVSMLL